MEATAVIEPSAGKGLTGSTLKIIAIVTMFIDHIGAAIFEDLRITSHVIAKGEAAYMTWGLIDLALRLIGRVAFPIFCFLLVEGFLHTRDVKKYALRLGIFCLISELPFNLAFYGQLSASAHQNVFFTLFIGLLVLIGLDHFKAGGWRCALGRAVCTLAGAGVAALLRTDYSAFGVCVIVCFYLLHDKKIARDISSMVALVAASPLEITGLLSLIPIHLYNGKRGISLKYFFYLFYPVHLLVLCCIRELLLLTVLS